MDRHEAQAFNPLARVPNEFEPLLKQTFSSVGGMEGGGGRKYCKAFLKVLSTDGVSISGEP